MLHGTEPSGAVIGILGGRPIHEAVVDRSGSRYEFRGAVPRLATGDVDVLALADAEWIVDGCMVYAACNRAARTR